MSPGANRKVEVAVDSRRKKEASTYWKKWARPSRLAHSSMDTSSLTAVGMSCSRSSPPGTVSPLGGGGIRDGEGANHQKWTESHDTCTYMYTYIYRL